MGSGLLYFKYSRLETIVSGLRLIIITLADLFPPCEFQPIWLKLANPNILCPDHSASTVEFCGYPLQVQLMQIYAVFLACVASASLWRYSPPKLGYPHSQNSIMARSTAKRLGVDAPCDVHSPTRTYTKTSTPMQYHPRGFRGVAPRKNGVQKAAKCVVFTHLDFKENDQLIELHVVKRSVKIDNEGPLNQQFEAAEDQGVEAAQEGTAVSVEESRGAGFCGSQSRTGTNDVAELQMMLPRSEGQLKLMTTINLYLPNDNVTVNNILPNQWDILESFLDI